jgi:hypothetical protein
MVAKARALFLLPRNFKARGKIEQMHHCARGIRRKWTVLECRKSTPCGNSTKTWPWAYFDLTVSAFWPDRERILTWQSAYFDLTVERILTWQWAYFDLTVSVLWPDRWANFYLTVSVDQLMYSPFQLTGEGKGFKIRESNSMQQNPSWEANSSWPSQ